MSKYIFSRCNKENLNTIPKTDGQIIYVKDTNELYFDIDNNRVDFDFIICVKTQDEITNPIVGKLYFIEDINALGVYSDENLHIIKSETSEINAEDVTYDDTSEIGTNTVQGIIDYLITNMEIDKDTITQLAQAIEERRVEMKKYVDELVKTTKTEVMEYTDNSVKVVIDKLGVTDKNVSDLQEDTKSLQNTCLGYGYRIEKIDTDLGFLKDKVDTAKTDITTNTENITKLEKKVTTNTENISTLQSKTQELEDKITDVDNKVNTTKTELEENIKTTKENLEQNIDTREQTINDTIQQTKEDLQAEITQKETSINETIQNNKTELEQSIKEIDAVKIDKIVAEDTNNKILGDYKITKTEEENSITIETTKLNVITNTPDVENTKIISTNNDIEISTTEDGLDITIPKLTELKTSINETDGKITTLQEGTAKQLETIKEDITKNKNNITTLNETVEGYNEKINTAVSKVEELEVSQQTQDNKISVMETNIESNRVTTKANTTAIEGIRNEIDTYHHYFRGYYKTSTEIQELEGQIGDYAYCGETETIWVYTTVWSDSFDPTPNQVVPKTQTTPLMNGIASVGTEDSYAAGDHIHPTDVTRASEEEFQQFKTDIEGKVDNKLDKINETLLTNSKDIVGAINELYNMIQELKQ